MWHCFIRQLLIAVACFSVGCREPEPAVSTPEALHDYAALPGLSQSSNDELQAELARLIVEQATPLQLNRREHPIAITSAEPATLDTIFPKQTRSSLREKLDEVWPAEGFEFSSARLHVVAELLKRNRRPREQYRELAFKTHFAFETDHTRGLAADRSCLDGVHVGNRLEGLLAARHLADGKTDAAIECLRVMLHISETLAAEQNVVCRGFAARQRSAALQVVEGVAQHPTATRQTQRQLAAMISQQLARWPSDAQAWIGDRAQGLHTYELIRDGYLLSLLTYDEIREYRDQVGIQELAQLVAANIDRDELFYLKTMREVVEACERPFYLRSKLFMQIESNLEVLRASGTYPFVADQLLFVELEQGHRVQALDRARCEAWRLALRIAADERPAQLPTNPLTGDTFVIDTTDQHVIVDSIDPAGHRAVRVPIKPPASQPSRVGASTHRKSIQ